MVYQTSDLFKERCTFFESKMSDRDRLILSDIFEGVDLSDLLLQRSINSLELFESMCRILGLWVSHVTLNVPNKDAFSWREDLSALAREMLELLAGSAFFNLGVELVTTVIPYQWLDVTLVGFCTTTYDKTLKGPATADIWYRRIDSEVMRWNGNEVAPYDTVFDANLVVTGIFYGAPSVKQTFYGCEAGPHSNQKYWINDVEDHDMNVYFTNHTVKWGGLTLRYRRYATANEDYEYIVPMTNLTSSLFPGGLTEMIEFAENLGTGEEPEEDEDDVFDSEETPDTVQTWYSTLLIQQEAELDDMRASIRKSAEDAALQLLRIVQGPTICRIEDFGGQRFKSKYLYRFEEGEVSKGQFDPDMTTGFRSDVYNYQHVTYAGPGIAAQFRDPRSGKIFWILMADHKSVSEYYFENGVDFPDEGPDFLVLRTFFCQRNDNTVKDAGLGIDLAVPAGRRIYLADYLQNEIQEQLGRTCPVPLEANHDEVLKATEELLKSLAAPTA